jgi:hypothetical protein
MKAQPGAMYTFPAQICPARLRNGSPGGIIDHQFAERLAS